MAPSKVTMNCKNRVNPNEKTNIIKKKSEREQLKGKKAEKKQIVKVNKKSPIVNKKKSVVKELKKANRKKGSIKLNKYPGISFLKSKINLNCEKKGILNLQDFEILKNQREEEYQRMKRRVKRQTRRDKEKIFRHNLERAFDFQNVEIVEEETLLVKIEEDLFKEKGNFSNFPFNFRNWVSKENFYWNKTLDIDVSESSEHSRILPEKDGNNSLSSSDDVFSDLENALKRSKGVNGNGAKEIVSVLDNLKELDFVNSK